MKQDGFKSAIDDIRSEKKDEPTLAHIITEGFDRIAESLFPQGTPLVSNEGDIVTSVSEAIIELTKAIEDASSTAQDQGDRLSFTETAAIGIFPSVLNGMLTRALETECQWSRDGIIAEAVEVSADAAVALCKAVRG